MSATRAASASRPPARIDITTSISVERKEHPVFHTRADVHHHPDASVGSGAIASGGRHFQESYHSELASNKIFHPEETTSSRYLLGEEMALLKLSVQSWKELLPFLRYEQRNYRVLNSHRRRVRRAKLTEYLNLWRERYVRIFVFVCVGTLYVTVRVKTWGPLGLTGLTRRRLRANSLGLDAEQSSMQEVLWMAWSAWLREMVRSKRQKGSSEMSEIREAQMAVRSSLADTLSSRRLRKLVTESFLTWRGKVRGRRRLLQAFRKLAMRSALKCASKAFRTWKTAFDKWQNLRTGIGALFAKVNRRLCVDMLWSWLHAALEVRQHLHAGGALLLRSNTLRRARFLAAWRATSKSRAVLREYSVHVAERRRLWVIARGLAIWAWHARRDSHLRSRNVTASSRARRSSLRASFLSW
jgi:hypothetical protein